MSLTEQQRRAVEARGKVIVTASAGSGKTHTMIERYASILARGEADITEMLAVTFTNKAASEMRDRAGKRLLELYRAAGESEKARLYRQIEGLPLAEICTIHSFCGRLVRTYFYLVDVDPRYRIADTDNAEGKALMARALDAAFERAYEENSPWFTLLLSVYFRKKKDRRLKEIVSDLYKKLRNDPEYMSLLLRYAERSDPAWEDAHFAAAGEIDAERAFSDAENAVLSEIRRRAEDVKTRLVGFLPYLSEHFPNGGAFAELLLNAAARVENAEDYEQYLSLARPALPNAPAKSKKDGEETRYCKQMLQTFAKQVKELYAGEEDGTDVRYQKFLNARTFSSALAKLLLVFDETYRAVKKENGVLDYGDLEHLALKILRDPAAGEAVRGKYKFLFVDEYQDVNPMQDAILSALAGEECFFVGDKKQAIYGFRGSRTRFFSAKEREFPNVLSLDANFRSAPAILAAANAVFPASMEDYRPMTGGDAYAGHSGSVELHFLEREEEELPARGVYSVAAASYQETGQVAARVLAIIGQECGWGRAGLARTYFDVRTGKEKPVTYGDIAVLVRKKSLAAGEIVRALSEHGIPVTATAEVNICDFFEVRLIIDWLSYLDNAAQDIPLFSALLSSIGGFTDSELARIRLKTEKTLHFHGTFRDAVKLYANTYEKAKDPLALRLLAFFRKAEDLRTRARILTAAETIGLLLASGLEAQIAAKGDAAARMRRVRRLIAESENTADIHAFLTRIADAEEFIAYSESGGADAVRVMTMHAAKGLEFPVVILCDLDAAFHGVDAKDETLWTEEFGVSAKSFFVSEEGKTYCESVSRAAAKDLLLRQEIEGECNLLYVAMTRAKYRMHMIFDKPREKSGYPDPLFCPMYAKKLADLLPASFLAQGQEVEPVLPAKASALVYKSDPEVVESIYAAGEKYAYEASTRVPLKSSATELMKREITRVGGGHTAEEGTAYHAFLEHYAFGEPIEAELGRMRREDLLDEAQLAALDPARLTEIVRLPVFDLKGKTVWRERRFLVRFPARTFAEQLGESTDDEVTFQGAIDLLIPREGGFTVVDYKLSEREDEDLKSHYAVQMKLYQKTVAKIYGIEETQVDVKIVNLAKLRVVDF